MTPRKVRQPRTVRTDRELLCHDLGESGTCTTAGAANVFAFELGAPIEPAALASAFVYEVGGESIRRRGFAGPGGAVVLWGEIVDVGTGETCAPDRAIDGARRCLPATSATVELFADEECTARAFAEPIASCGRGGSPRFVRAPSEEGSRVFEVIGQVSELYDVRQGKTGGACRRFTPVVPSRGFTVTEIDVSRFAVVEERELPAP